MIARTVRLQRPQSEPAPHALATSLHVLAPHATASATMWLVAPVQRHTNMALANRLAYPMSRWSLTPASGMTTREVALH
jgi:hypothetical protein